MLTYLESIKTHFWKIAAIVGLLFGLSKGCTTSKLLTLEKQLTIEFEELNDKVIELDSKIQERATKKEVADICEEVMFDFIIYEDDMDKGKISKSDIKNLIESND